VVLQGGVDDAGLDTGAPALDVDFENAVEAGQVEQNAAAVGHHPAGAVRGTAARHHRNVELRCDAHDLGNLVATVRAQHEFGDPADSPEVAAALGEHGGVGDDLGDGGEPLDRGGCESGTGCGGGRGHRISFGGWRMSLSLSKQTAHVAHADHHFAGALPRLRGGG